MRAPPNDFIIAPFWFVTLVSNKPFYSNLIEINFVNMKVKMKLYPVTLVFLFWILLLMHGCLPHCL